MLTELIIRSILLGAGLAMDAFSVSLADGLEELNMKAGRMLTIAGTFALFQFAMPMAGWVLVRTAVEKFNTLEMFIPWIALLLLLYIGGKMLTEGIRDRRSSGGEEAFGISAGETGERAAGTPDGGTAVRRLTAGTLIVQGIATSIDALSVGFTTEAYNAAEAFFSSAIIGVVTLAICMAGLYLGKKIGTRLSGQASILGGVILIAIGIEIWAKGVLL